MATLQDNGYFWTRPYSGANIHTPSKIAHVLISSIADLAEGVDEKQ